MPSEVHVRIVQDTKKEILTCKPLLSHIRCRVNIHDLRIRGADLCPRRGPSRLASFCIPLDAVPLPIRT